MQDTGQHKMFESFEEFTRIEEGVGSDVEWKAKDAEGETKRKATVVLDKLWVDIKNEAYGGKDVIESIEVTDIEPAKLSAQARKVTATFRTSDGGLDLKKLPKGVFDETIEGFSYLDSVRMEGSATLSVLIDP